MKTQVPDRLSLFLTGKELIEKNEIEKGVNYLENAIKKGCIEAVNYYCLLLIKGKILNKDLSKAKSILKKYLNKNDPTTFLLFGKIMKKEENFKEAIRYFKKSSKLGNSEAMYELGKLYIKGDKVPIDENQAMKYFSLSKKKGFTKSDKYLTRKKEVEQTNSKFKIIAIFIIILILIFCCLLFFYFKKRQKNVVIIGDKFNSVAQEQEQTNIYLKESADSGNPDAMFNYGLHLWEGKGTEADLKEAAIYFKNSADSGVVDAMINYAHMAYLGEGTPVNREEACRYFKMAADEGSENAMLLYATLTENGDGCSFDMKEAIKYYEMSAKKGQLDAICRLGMLYQDGKGVKKNIKKANKYYKMGADKGHPASCGKYGYNLYFGHGLKVNYKEAFKYFKQAAEKGDIEIGRAHV